MSPLSNDPSFMTMWCTVLSAFFQTTTAPCVMGAGLGLKDCSFLWPMMVTVAAPAGAVFDVVGAGALGLVLDDGPPLPLHPHAAKAKIARAMIRDRMEPHYAIPMPAKTRRLVAIVRARFTQAVR